MPELGFDCCPLPIEGAISESEVPGGIQGRKVDFFEGRPREFPFLNPDEVLVAVTKDPLGKVANVLIGNVSGAQDCYDTYAEGWTFTPPKFFAVKASTVGVDLDQK